MSWRTDRLLRIVDSFATNVSRWSLERHLNREPKFDPKNAKGLSLSLCLQGTLERVVELRQVNPLSIAHFADSSKHILVATDAQGRRTGSEPKSSKPPHSDAAEMVLPHLTGLRVHVSVENDNNDPSDRLKGMLNLFLFLSVNIAPVASEIAKMIKRSCKPRRKTTKQGPVES